MRIGEEPAPVAEAWAYGAGEWMGAVERETARHRRARAGHHRSEAARARACAQASERARRRLEKQGKSFAASLADREVTESESRARWHNDRARGQVDRFHARAACGEGVAEVRCQVCEYTSPTPVGCSVVRLCVRCRDVRAQRRRAVLWRARQSVLDEARAMGLLRRARKGGAWGEKHLTLTMPDPRCGGPKQRIATAFGAWRYFSIQLQRYVKARGGRAPWYSRCFEWTPGRDGMGHPHFHVWIVSPFLPVELVRRWWARALELEGVRILETDPLINLADVRMRNIVREVHKGGQTFKVHTLRSEDPQGHVIGYVEGWSVSEVGKHGDANAEPDIMARVYEALEGRRHVQPSRGLMARGAHEHRCPCCNSTEWAIELTTYKAPDLQSARQKWGLPDLWTRPLARAGPRKGSAAAVSVA